MDSSFQVRALLCLAPVLLLVLSAVPASCQIQDPLSIPTAGPGSGARAQMVAAQESQFQYVYNDSFWGANKLPPRTTGPGYAAILGGEIQEVVLGRYLPYRVVLGQAVQGEIGRLIQEGYAPPNDLQIKSYDDYALLYRNWPQASELAMSGNYSDEYFAREQFTSSPVFLKKAGRKLPFALADADVAGLLDVGVTLKKAVRSGMLYKLDFPFLGPYVKFVQPGLQAFDPVVLFYFSVQRKKLIPLAIKPLSSSPLIFTPVKSSPAAWLMAKSMVASIDTPQTAFYHYLVTHFVLEPVLTGALRKLAPQHPVRVLVQRFLHFQYGARSLAEMVLWTPGNGTFYDHFPYNYSMPVAVLTDIYKKYDFSKVDIDRDIEERGIKHLVDAGLFTYINHARKVQKALKTLVQNILRRYYKRDRDVRKDPELQAWAKEVVQKGRVKGFPKSFSSVRHLVRAITRVAYCTSVLHHATNSFQVGEFAIQYPFRPTRFLEPFPTTAGEIGTTADIFKILPKNAVKIGLTLGFASIFGRPLDPTGAEDIDKFLTAPLNSSVFAGTVQTFQKQLATVSAEIEAEAAATKVLPYTLLKHERLPYYCYI